MLSGDGFLERADDQLRSGRPQHRVAEPVARFHYAVMRPRWAALSRRAIEWEPIRPTVGAQVFGPFEGLARDWVARVARPETLDAGNVPPVWPPVAGRG